MTETEVEGEVKRIELDGGAGQDGSGAFLPKIPNYQLHGM